MKHQREFYVPKGATKIEHKASSAVAYVYENPKRPEYVFAIGFHGKAQKPDFHFRYRNDEKGRAEREKRIRQHFAAWEAVEARQKERREEAKAFEHDFKVGDIFRSSWGYDQTNQDYYEIVEVRGKMLIVREIGQEREAVGWEQHKCVPVPGKFVGEPFRVKAQKFGFKVDRHWATFEKPQIVAGVKVYEPSHATSYA